MLYLGDALKKARLRLEGGGDNVTAISAFVRKGKPMNKWRNKQKENP